MSGVNQRQKFERACFTVKGNAICFFFFCLSNYWYATLDFCVIFNEMFIEMDYRLNAVH